MRLLGQTLNQEKAVVALEVFENSDTLLRRANAKTTDSQKLLRSLQKKKKWDLSEQGYLKILEHCQKENINIEGISPKERECLKETDQHFAEAILSLRAKHPNKKIFVLVGESHLAPEHLPAKLKKLQHLSLIHI